MADLAVVVIKEELVRKRVALELLRLEIVVLEKQLKDNCKHENTTIVQIHEPGDYYNTSATWKKEICLECDKILAESEKKRGGYG